MFINVLLLLPILQRSHCVTSAVMRGLRFNLSIQGDTGFFSPFRLNNITSVDTNALHDALPTIGKGHALEPFALGVSHENVTIKEHGHESEQLLSNVTPAGVVVGENQGKGGNEDGGLDAPANYEWIQNATRLQETMTPDFNGKSPSNIQFPPPAYVAIMGGPDAWMKRKKEAVDKMGEFMSRMIKIEASIPGEHYIDWEGTNNYIHVTQLVKKLPHLMWYCTLIIMILVLCLVLSALPSMKAFFAKNEEALSMEEKIRDIFA